MGIDETVEDTEVWAMVERTTAKKQAMRVCETA